MNAARIDSTKELLAMRRAGRLVAQTLHLVREQLRPGVTTADVDRWVRDFTAAHGARCSQLGYHGFPAGVCTSRNEVVCHGIPSESVVLREGDIVNVDVTSELNGWHADASATYLLGEVREDVRRLVTAAREALQAGIAAVRPGAFLGDVGAAVEGVARSAGCAVVTDWGGHGIGREMHLPPHVSHVGPAGRGLRLRQGMVFTIEPMLTLGLPTTRVLTDGWTVVTCDGSWSAQFEHTVLVTERGAEVLTLDEARDPRHA